jgi:hypothetical protein
MNIWVVLWLCSAAGAALFFVAGLAAGRGRRAPAVKVAPAATADVTPGPALEAQISMLRQQVATAREEHAREQAAAHQTARDIKAVQDHVERLRIDLMRARKETVDLEHANKARQAELAGARGQLAKLRAELAASQEASQRARAPVTVRAAGSKAGDVLQELVDKVSGSQGVRCAVVADDLGLVVASHGELGDEVAAVGALFGRAGLQAQKVLPLRKVQRVTVEDDQDVTLTLRPLQTDESVEGDLALITLAIGAAPERPGKVMNESRSARAT